MELPIDDIRTNIANNVGNRNWNHNPAHRGNVAYRDRGVAQRYGNAANAANGTVIHAGQWVAGKFVDSEPKKPAAKVKKPS